MILFDDVDVVAQHVQADRLEGGVGFICVRWKSCLPDTNDFWCWGGIVH
jgi:hypothetical protein